MWHARPGQSGGCDAPHGDTQAVGGRGNLGGASEGAECDHVVGGRRRADAPRVAQDGALGAAEGREVEREQADVGPELRHQHPAFDTAPGPGLGQDVQMLTVQEHQSQAFLVLFGSCYDPALTLGQLRLV